MSDDAIKKGDYVRVVIEGEWGRDGWHYGPQTHRELGGLEFREGDQITVERAERPAPPVEVFKAGDLVCSEHGSRYVILRDGYADWPNGRYWPWDDFVGKHSFTSEGYTKVSLLEAPF